MKLYIFLLTLLLSLLLSNNIKAQDQKLMVFYNLENLFDIYDDPDINDADFLPGSRIDWTGQRYQRKLDNLTRVLISIDETYLPAIIGVCEVENEKVLKDLKKQKKLKRANYKIVHHDSPDERGIDVALLYAGFEFKVLEDRPIPVRFPHDPDDRTRDILYVKGVFKEAKKDTVFIFVNHWPSRWGGQEQSEPDRITAARVLRGAIDSIYSYHEKANIILMGDFNDDPDNTSLLNVLDAQQVVEEPEDRQLYNLMFPMLKRGEGTLFYNDWDVFDQIIVSGALLNKTEGFRLADTQGKAFKADWMLFEDDRGRKRPNRTAGRSSYYGGYSDHLPVYVYYRTK
jgi:predicted extracellular nuclease